MWSWIAAEPFGATQPNNNPNNFGTFVFNQRFPGQVYDAEMNLHQNHHREFQGLKGGYLQSDPIGLQGGINTYAYVSGNPTNNVDPTGLVKWTGTSLSGGGDIRGAGGGIEIFTLTSECVNKKRVVTRVRATYFGLSVGSPFNYTGGFADFKDSLTEPNASVFNGTASKFSLGSIGTPAGGVVLYQATQLGGAGSSGWFNYQMGIDVGAVSWASHGKSEVLWARSENCDC